MHAQSQLLRLVPWSLLSGRRGGDGEVVRMVGIGRSPLQHHHLLTIKLLAEVSHTDLMPGYSRTCDLLRLR